MAALSILSTFPPSNSSHSLYFNPYECKYNIYYNNVFLNNLYSKPDCSASSHHFSLSTTSIVSKPNYTSLKVSSMHTQFSKSGRGQSWIQDNSMHQLFNSSDKYLQGPLHSFFPEGTAQVSSVKDLYEFICSGPLVSKVGLTEERIAESIDKWISYGYQLCKLFQLNPLFLNVPQKARFYHYYIPVFIWCEDKISEHMSQFKDGEDATPLVIGFSAPQGCGKTTLVFALEYLFRATGRKCATLSIDDFYLTAEGQAKLRETNPGNALLEFRGNAGSHDLQLSIETLTAVTKLTKEGMKMKLPRYDKSAYSGRGDRADPSTWPEVEGPLTAVLFEGWMLGFKPLPAETVKAVDPQLEMTNKNLEAYYDAWDKFVDAWIVIKIQDPSCVYQWRLQAEIAMREAGNPGMTDEEVDLSMDVSFACYYDFPVSRIWSFLSKLNLFLVVYFQVRDFVSRYLPAYHAYLPTLYSQGPNGSDPDKLLVVEIDEMRNPILGV